jgi:uncharacterized membrane protein YoaK (UPF0700 family)
MQTLHKPESVFSYRHLPSWLMLCFAAGAVNGTALLACERFVTHVTGSVTRLGVEMMHFTIMVDFALVVVCFILGAMMAGLLINGRIHRGKPPLFAVPLWLTSGTTACVAIAGQLRWLGPFGGAVDESGDFVFLCALSFAMGLQNAAVATSTGALVRTTHLTGPTTDLGIHLAELCFIKGPAREVVKQHATLRTGKLLMFALGAAVAVPLSHDLGFLTLLIPAAIVAAASRLSFTPSSSCASQSARGVATADRAATGSGAATT